MRFKKITILILFLIVITVVSGCGKKEWPLVVQDDNGQEVEETATSTEEIDISDWQTYRDDKYGFEIKYPKGWKINLKKNQDNYFNFFDPQSRVDFLGLTEYVNFSVNINKINIDFDFDSYIKKRIEEINAFTSPYNIKTEHDLSPTVEEININGNKAVLLGQYSDLEGAFSYVDLFIQNGDNIVYNISAQSPLGSPFYDNFYAFYSSIIFLK